MDAKHQVEVQESFDINTKEVLELPNPKPVRSNLFRTLLSFGAGIASLFVVYIGLNKFQQRSYSTRNLPIFGLFKCVPHLYYNSLQTFEFDPKEFDRFSFSGYDEYNGNSVKFAKHSDSSNVKILYDIHASDQYTLENTKTYFTTESGYRFHVDSPKSSFFVRHCIKLQLTISFPENLEEFKDVYISGNFDDLTVTADLNTKFGSVTLRSQDGMSVESIKANSLSASTVGILHVRNVQLNNGTLSSSTAKVIVKGVEKFEVKPGNEAAHYRDKLEVKGKQFVFVSDTHVAGIYVSSEESQFEKVDLRWLNVQAGSDVHVSEATINLIHISSLGGKVVTTTKDSYLVVINSKKGSAFVDVKSLGNPNVTWTRQVKDLGSRSYYFEVSNLDGISSIRLPSSFEGIFEAIARNGESNVNSTSDSSKIHFEESKTTFKKGYHGNNKNSTNKVKVETGGYHTRASIQFY